MKNEVKNWLSSAQYDLETAEHLFNAGRYIYPELSDFYKKTSRTGVSPVLRGEMLGQPGRLSYRGLGILASKNRSV